ncbi:MAG: helix-turn-helix transcriptional regulator [Patescibacteria group bacterium]
MGQIIKELREKIGLSSKELAEKSGLSPAYISKIENGDSISISLKTSKQLADGLGITLKDFLESIGLLDKKEKPSFKMITESLRSNGYSPKETELITTYAKFIKKELRMEK